MERTYYAFPRSYYVFLLMGFVAYIGFNMMHPDARYEAPVDEALFVYVLTLMSYYVARFFYLLSVELHKEAGV